MEENVVLVNTDGLVRLGQDDAILTSPKLQAHQLGLLHSAESVFLFDDDRFDSHEVPEWRWASIADLLQEIEQQPEHFTEWLKLCISEVLLGSGR